MADQTPAKDNSGRGRPFVDGIGPRLWLLAGCWRVKIGDFAIVLAPNVAKNGQAAAMNQWLNPKIGQTKDTPIREAIPAISEKVLAKELSARGQGEAKLSDALQGTLAQFFAFMSESEDRGTKTIGRRVSPSTITTTEFDLVGLDEGSLNHYLNQAFPHIMGIGQLKARPTLKDTTARLQTLLFMYRLGFHLPEEHDTLRFRKDGLKLVGDTLGLVLRRIPARLVYEPGAPYRLKYEEYYEDELAGESDAFRADAFMYVFKNFATIISKDAGGGIDRRLSLVHVDWQRMKNNRDGFLPGVIATDSDCYPQADDVAPTAYRVLFARAPNNLKTKGKAGETNGKGSQPSGPDGHWEILKQYSRSIKLKDSNKDGLIDLSDGAQWGVEDDLGATHPVGWVEYFNRLNVIRCPIDLHLARYTNFGKERPRAKFSWVERE
jgi:hypothetical protein